MRFFSAFSVVSVIVLLIVGCSQKTYHHYEGVNAELGSIYTGSDLESVIAPYRLAVDSTMNKRIGFAPKALIKNAPESTLSNFAVDLVFEVGMRLAKNQVALQNLNADNTIALLNFGGLRAPINQGDISIGNIYELMPFDNTVMITKIDSEGVEIMTHYLKQEGGQPISNCKIDYRNNSSDMKINNKAYNGTEIYVITSNYLAAGGDGMNFLQEANLKWDSGVLIRDVFIEHISSVDTLFAPKLNGRIQF